jgi:hypothetical protein
LHPARAPLKAVAAGNRSRRSCRRPPQTVTAAVAAIAQFLEHRRQVTRREAGRTVVVQKGISGMGTEQMKEWTEGFIARSGNGTESVLMMDRLQAHRNPGVLGSLRQAHIEPFLLPPQTAKLISPCDNSFFASFKARLRTMDTSTTEAKKAAFNEICREYDPEEVKRYFRHCGWEFE